MSGLMSPVDFKKCYCRMSLHLLMPMSHVRFLKKTCRMLLYFFEDLSHVTKLNVACQTQEMAVLPCRFYGSRAINETPFQLSAHTKMPLLLQ